MDNPTRWNITNSAQTIVSALVDPSKQYDNVFRREWATTFASFSKHKPTNSRSKFDAELNSKLKDYVSRLDRRKSFVSNEHSDSTRDQESWDTLKIDIPDAFTSVNFQPSGWNSLDPFLTLGTSDRGRASIRPVSDRLILERPEPLTKDMLREVQQKLSHYTDVIEEYLAKRISSRSGDFFQVMSSVDSVMDELSLAIKSTTQLRRKCKSLRENVMSQNMKSINLSNTRDNAQTYLDKLVEIAHLCKVQPMIQVLLSESDFVGALDLISKSRVKLHKDLSRVISLRHMESQLSEIERMIGTMMQQEFLSLISSEWDGSFSEQSSAAERLSKLFDYFANGRSEIPDRGQLTLLSLLQIQAEKFVNQFHEERKKRVEAALDVEQWKVVEVPKDFQRLISMMIDERVKIGDLFTRENLQKLTQNGGLPKSSSGVSITNFVTNNNSHDGPVITKSGVNSSNNAKSSEKQAKDSLILSSSNKDKPRVVHEMYIRAAGSDFVVVNSVINLIRTVMDYCKCAYGIKSLSADLLERLFKILHLYNSKTYHLVYSAGAVHTAGLRAITTRSLIVSQRSLKLIILIIPALQLHFSALLPRDKRLRRFTEIKSVYEEHVLKIPERVIAIVRDIIDLQLLEWEAKPPVPSAQFNSVAQHFIRLHDNIQDTLPEDELISLFAALSETFTQVLVKHLRRLNITNDAGPQQWLVMQELTFYRISLSKLKAFQMIDMNFDDIWSSLTPTVEQVQEDLNDNGENKDNEVG